MATVRLIVVLLVLGTVVLLGVQNLAPALPLVFFGGSTQALPLGVWLVSAILLGALTTLVLTALLGSTGGGSGNRSAAYKYRPQSFYEPTGSGTASSGQPGPRGTTAQGPRYPASSSGPNTPPATNDDPSWRDWTSLKSPGQWNDWESLSRSAKPDVSSTATSSGILDGVTTWFSSSKREAKQQQRVNESLQELDDDWGDMEHRPYSAPGASPVQDHLDDISQGWQQPSDPSRDFEASQAPRRVYRDGSLYSYSYRGDDAASGSSGQVDNIYAPPDDVYGDDDPDPRYATNAYDADYDSDYTADEVLYDNAGAGGYDEVAGSRFEDADDMPPLGEPEVAEDGVVDADYRVIESPYRAAAEATATASEPRPLGNAPAAADDWDEADDALTP